MARELGFDNINMDLIVGLPGESLDDVADTMEVMRKLAPDNLTVHSLAVKRAARLNMDWAKYQNFKIVNTKEHIDLTAEWLQRWDYLHIISTVRRIWQATSRTSDMRSRARPAYTMS